MQDTIKEFVGEIRRELHLELDDRVAYSEEDRRYALEKVERMSDEEILGIYLRNHNLHLEYINDMVSDILGM